jgi:Flp pilus assembly secretin CpaC
LIKELRKANRPYSEVSRIVGVPVTTIEYWEAEAKKDTSILRSENACIFPDVRIKLKKTDRQKIRERVAAGRDIGWTQQEVANHPKITVKDQSSISKIMKKSDPGQIHNLFYQSHKIAEVVGITQPAVFKIITELNQLNLSIKSDYSPKGQC